MVPLLEMGDSVLIMISTPVDSFNFYTELMELRDPITGERILHSYVEELICPKCKETEHPEDCRHYLFKIPPWKSAAKLDIVKQIYRVRHTHPSTRSRTQQMADESPSEVSRVCMLMAQQNQKETLKRESMGVVTDSGAPLVDKKILEVQTRV